MAYKRKSFPMHKGTSSHKSAVKQKATKRMALKRMEGTKEAFASGALLGGTLKKKAKKASDTYKKSMITGMSEYKGEKAMRSLAPKLSQKAKSTGAHESLHGEKNLAQQNPAINPAYRKAQIPKLKKAVMQKAKSTGVHEATHGKLKKAGMQKTKSTGLRAAPQAKMQRTLTRAIKKKPETKMLEGTTIFGKTIPEIKKLISPPVNRLIKKFKNPKTGLKGKGGVLEAARKVPPIKRPFKK